MNLDADSMRVVWRRVCRWTVGADKTPRCHIRPTFRPIFGFCKTALEWAAEARGSVGRVGAGVTAAHSDIRGTLV